MTTSSEAPVTYRRTRTKAIGAGVAAVAGTAVVAGLLSGGLTGASWSDQIAVGDGDLRSTAQLELTTVTDLTWMGDMSADAAQPTFSGDFSPYPGVEIRREWRGMATTLGAGYVSASFGDAAFDIQDASGNSIGDRDWAAAFDPRMTVSIDGVTYEDEDPVTPGVQFNLPADVVGAQIVVSVEGTYPADAGNETMGETVSLAFQELAIFQSAVEENHWPAAQIMSPAPGGKLFVGETGTPSSAHAFLEGRGVPGARLAMRVVDAETGRVIATTNNYSSSRVSDDGTWSMRLLGSGYVDGDYVVQIRHAESFTRWDAEEGSVTELPITVERLTPLALGLTGEAVVGETLTATADVVQAGAYAPTRVTYRWYRDGVDTGVSTQQTVTDGVIPSATYLLTEDDLGAEISVRVIPNYGGANGSSVNSDPTLPVVSSEPNDHEGLDD